MLIISLYFNNTLEHSNDIVYISADAYISNFYNEEKALGSSGQKKLEQIKLYLNQNKSVYILDDYHKMLTKSWKKWI